MSSSNQESVDQQRDFRRAEVVNLPASLEAVEQGRSLVVVIGINKYVHQHTLKNAVQDAIGLQQTLIDKLGFSAPIPPLLNEAATKSAISSLVDDRLYEVVEENDSLIIFFAGHGTTRVRKIGGKEIETGYLIPVDATQSWSEYVEIDPFLRSIGALPARHILVILDSCESGLALGQAMQSYRDTTRYTKDLSSRFSRKVITSAQRDQLAKDGGGPIPGHSLFTGTLIDGFNWGKADLDSNGLISSSELGLFIQQQVAQASKSKQTPDFGSFHLDDRGEMVILLYNQSFDALKARAFYFLQGGDFINFKELVKQLEEIQSSSPEVLYLKYRLSLIENNIEQAIDAINQLIEIHPQEGKIPISKHDLQELSVRLSYWMPLLEIPESEFPVNFEMLNGRERDYLQPIQEQSVGDNRAFLVESETFVRLRFTNSTDTSVFIYMFEIDSEGRLEPMSLWDNDEIMWTGLKSNSSELSYLFRISGVGMNEFRLYASPKRVRILSEPPGVPTRAASVPAVDEKEFLLSVFGEKEPFKRIKKKSLYYLCIQSTY